MKALIVYAHPNPKSLNHAILEAAKAALEARGAEVKVADLYALNFDPVLRAADFEANQGGQPLPEVAAQQELVRWADHLIFVYPLWWVDRPAILKGWVDRVFSYGFAYAYGEAGIDGLLAGKKALAFTTAGTPDLVPTQATRVAAHLEAMDQGTFAFTGMEVVGHEVFNGVPMMDEAGRLAVLEAVRQRIAAL